MNLFKKLKERKKKKEHQKWLRGRRYDIEIKGNDVIVRDQYSGETYKKTSIQMHVGFSIAREMAARGLTVDKFTINGNPWQEHLKGRPNGKGG